MVVEQNSCKIDAEQLLTLQYPHKLSIFEEDNRRLYEDQD